MLSEVAGREWQGEGGSGVLAHTYWWETRGTPDLAGQGHNHEEPARKLEDADGDAQRPWLTQVWWEQVPGPGGWAAAAVWTAEGTSGTRF